MNRFEFEETIKLGRKEREEEIIEILKENGLNGIIKQIKEQNGSAGN